jgi:plastocyanin
MSRAVVCISVAMLFSACSAPDAPVPAGASSAAAATTATQVEGRAPRGALLTLEPAGGAPLPEGNAVLDQFAKAFVPETLFVRVGQSVVFKNSEDQLHNVTVVRSATGTGVFNISQNQGDVYTHTFEQPGEYDVTCDVHPGMRGIIVATTSPYAMYATADGRFAFAQVPPGEYTLRVTAGGRQFARPVHVEGARLDLGEVR